MKTSPSQSNDKLAGYLPAKKVLIRHASTVVLTWKVLMCKGPFQKKIAIQRTKSFEEVSFYEHRDQLLDVANRTTFPTTVSAQNANSPGHFTILSFTRMCCMMLFLDVGLVPTFWQKPSRPPPCLPKMQIGFTILWSCPWHTSAVWRYFLTLGLFQLSHKSLPNLHRVCPNVNCPCHVMILSFTR